MKVKTAEMAGDLLAWAVAKAAGRDMFFDENGEGPWFRDSNTYPDGNKTDYGSWDVCGPIIEREKISLSEWTQTSWTAKIHYADAAPKAHQYGATPLIAAMRCYVASTLGEEVEVPMELMKEREPAPSFRP